MPSIDHARSQQLSCAEYIIGGGPDQRGATLGLFDWFAEEFILSHENTHGEGVACNELA